MYEQLKKTRLKRNIPVQDLCSVIGIKTESAYYKKETGSIRFSLAEAKKIADFIGETIEEIFFTDELSEMD